MTLLGNILGAVASLLHTLIFIYSLVIIVSALISWVQPDPYNPIVRTLRSLTEPVYYRIRRRLPFLMRGGLDLTPMVLLLALFFIDAALVSTLAEWAVKLKLG